MVAQHCIQEGMPKKLVLNLCHIARSSFYYKPVSEVQKRGRSISKSTKKQIGGCEADSLVVDHIKLHFSCVTRKNTLSTLRKCTG